jgi:hypothetical protein
LGLVYLRARYYDPQVGRFISIDPLPPIPILPQTINRYPYGGNNPVIMADPSGKLIGGVIIVAGAAIVVYKVGQWAVDWVGSLEAADKAYNLNRERAKAINEGNLERAAELQNQWAKQVAVTSRQLAKTAWDTPYGTTVSGPPPTSFTVYDAIGEITGFTISKLDEIANWVEGLFKRYQGRQVRGISIQRGGYGYSGWGGPPSGGK